MTRVHSSTVTIGGRPIGQGHPVYVIAELSANHGQQLGTAMELIAAARGAGADAIKLQTYTPDTMTIDSDQPWFQVSGTRWEGRRLYELYAEAQTPWGWHAPLKQEAERCGLHFFSTPFDETSVDFLESLGVPAYKIASFENIDVPLLRKVARTGKPVIMSTGMATLAELDEAVATIRNSGGNDLVLLKCTSAYPAPPESMNLRTIPHLSATFGVPVGLSDHTLDTLVPAAAVALGATVIEKHLTLSRSVPGPDSAFSLEPSEFRAMVDAVRATERSLGTVRYGASDEELATRAFRRSIFVVRDVRRGETFSADSIKVIRPGLGLHPRHLDEIVGRVATQDIVRGTPLSWDLVGPSRA